MMRIAFDVKGTLEGPKKNILLRVFEELQKRGHECVVWSNSYGYAVDCIRDNKLNAVPHDKRMKMDLDYDETKYFDVAIEDDRQQTWLAAKQFVWVDEIETAGWLLNKILGDSK